jgi:DNA-nicking Smr family endonuclease
MARRRDDRPGEGGADDDGALFRRTFADAAPLKRRRPTVTVEPPPAPSSDAAPKRGTRKPAPTGLVPAPVAGPVLPPQPADVTARGSLAGIDRRTADRLRRGRLAIEARLDLHGSFQDDAHRALNDFIQRSAASRRRVVLVITGKGRISEGGGVLRRNVPQWLRMAPCAPHVLAIVPAQPQHGGSGALYVMLRRKRD